MKVTSVDFLLTFKCPAACQHCSYKAGPNRLGVIKPKKATQYLKELKENEPLEAVWIHGGEPFLYFNYLETILKGAKKLEIPHRGVITNSFWAKDEKVAREKLKRLKKAGLTTLTFSSDFFHQEFIPIDYVKNALTSAVNLDFDSIYVDSYYVDDVSTNNYFNQITKKNLEYLSDIKTVEFHKLPMSVEGRGTELMEHVKLRNELPSGKCPVPFWLDGDLENPETIEIDYEGNVTLCPGICIGNTQIQSLTEIIKNYDIYKHLILSVIWNEGPIGLLKIATDHGFKQNQLYANECHLCYDLRKFLQPYYPSFLAPNNCY